MGTMDIWYAHLDEDELMAAIRSMVAGTKKEAKSAKKGGRKPPKQEAKLAKAAQKRAEKTAAKAHTRDSVQALSKLGELVDGTYRIVSQPPVVVPFRDWTATYGLPADQVDKVIREQFRAYRATLQDDRRKLLERFQVVDAARKVVGVGSVGTRAFIVLLQGQGSHDPLFLQVKEATASVLEPYVGKSRYRQHGERVVQGQRMMQAASDIYLGWTKGVDVRRTFLLAAAARHEGLGAARSDAAGRAHVLRRHLRVDAGAGPRPVRGPGHYRRLPGRQRRVRQVDHRLLRAVRRPERAGLHRVRQGGSIRPAGGGRGRLRTGPVQTRCAISGQERGLLLPGYLLACGASTFLWVEAISGGGP